VVESRPGAMPRHLQIAWASAGCDDPEKTLSPSISAISAAHTAPPRWTGQAAPGGLTATKHGAASLGQLVGQHLQPLGEDLLAASSAHFITSDRPLKIGDMPARDLTLGWALGRRRRPASFKTKGVE